MNLDLIIGAVIAFCSFIGGVGAGFGSLLLVGAAIAGVRKEK